MGRRPGRIAGRGGVVPDGGDVVPDVVVADAAGLVLRRQGGEAGDGLALLQDAADRRTGAVVVGAEGRLEVAEAAGRVRFVAAGAGDGEVARAGPEPQGLAMAEMIHAIWFEGAS